MSKEILIDHTTLHALARRTISDRDLDLAARGLLQMIEHLLLAEVVWITDAVRGQTREISESLFATLCDYDLANPRNTGIARKAAITPANYLRACENAAPFIFESVKSLTAADLAASANSVSYAVRPAGVVPEDFPSVSRIEIGSSEAAEFINKGQHTLEWEITAATFLVHPRLHAWLIDMVKQAGNPTHSAYTQLNTILRWRINEQLAKTVACGKERIVYYTPAYGRAMAIDKHLSCLWDRNRQILTRNLSNVVLKQVIDDHEWLKLISFLGPTLDSDIPLFAIWLLPQLPEKCSMKHLLEGISQARDNEIVREVRRCLATEDTEGIEEMCRVVDSRIAANHGQGKMPAGGVRGKIKLVLKSTPPFFEVRSEVEIEKPIRNMGIFDFAHRIFGRSEVTLLTGFVNELIGGSGIYEVVKSRVRALLQGNSQRNMSVCTYQIR